MIISLEMHACMHACMATAALRGTVAHGIYTRPLIIDWPRVLEVNWCRLHA